MPTTRGAPANAPWINPPAWPRMGRSATVVGNATVESANVVIRSSRVPPARPAPPVLASAVSTSESCWTPGVFVWDSGFPLHWAGTTREHMEAAFVVFIHQNKNYRQSPLHMRHRLSQPPVCISTEIACSAEHSRLLRRRRVSRTAATFSWSRWRIVICCPSRQTRASRWHTAKCATRTTAGSTTPTPSGIKLRRSTWRRNLVRQECWPSSL